jgi:hypothetical protein
LQEIERASWPAPVPPKGSKRRIFRARRIWIALAAMVALVLTTAGAYLGYLNTLPTTVSLNVTNGQKEVAADAPVDLTFNRPVAADALKKALSVTPVTEWTLTSISGQTKYQWSPTKPLADLTTYTLTMKQFEDTTKHQVRASRWTFTTTIVPRVVSVTASDIGPVTDGAEVTPGAQITLTFNDAMVPSTVKVSAGTQPAGLTWAADSRSASMSTRGIPSGPLVLQLAAGAKDSTGHSVKDSWTLVTGLYYHDREHTTALKYPALIQVPNDEFARDQDGLQAADLVFEYLAEGGITRLTAIYSNAPDMIGPIRSSRLVSLKIGRHYEGLLFQSGESQVTQAAAGGDPVPQFFETTGYTFRSGSRIAPDNLMIAGDNVKRAEQNYFPNLPGFAIPKARPAGLTGGTPAATINVDEHNSTYSYDPVMGTYQKREEGHLYLDAHTRQQLRIEMLIVFHTTETQLAIGDGHGSFLHDFDLSTTGKADIYYKGQRYAGTWSGSDAHSPITFALANGQALPLPPGLVWIDVTQ